MAKKPSVSFILSFWGKVPSGGLRIVYEYANRLAQRSWRVSVVHPARLQPENGLSFIKKIQLRLGFFKNRLSGAYLPKKWFAIDRRVKMVWVPDLSERYIPEGDYIIACPVESAAFVNSYSSAKGKKHYFIQHFEDWALPAGDVEKTWKMPLKKIVIARWLQEKAKELGEEAIYIPNGLDFSSFDVDIPHSNRNQKTVLFLSHYLETKGTKFAVEAASRLWQKYPDLKVHAFGVTDKPSYFPDFIIYHKDPPQRIIRTLYNSARIFISPSLSEGWDLPTCEAMLCGCAVVATDIPGHREYLIDKENGVFCVPGSTDSIFEKVDWLFSNPAEAESIALRAPESLKKFDWDSRVTLFENALLS
jgi:glycosyltransferase involved in cell wall biosynthesis